MEQVKSSRIWVINMMRRATGLPEIECRDYSWKKLEKLTEESRLAYNRVVQKKHKI